jgi:hypothetical protein
MLLTDDTLDALAIGKAPIPVEEGQANTDLLLFLQNKPLDGPGGTDLAAEGTGEFAISDPWDENRAPQAFRSCLQEGGL